MNTPNRVVVTGIGLATPLGFDEAAVSSRLFSGQTGIKRVSAFDPAEYRSKNGAEVNSEELAAALASRGWRASDRATDLAYLSSAQALEQAGLLSASAGVGESTLVDPAINDLPVLIGTSAGPSHDATNSWQAFYTRGRRALRPSTVPRCMLNAVSSNISILFGLTGSNYAIVSACASSTVALGLAFRMIRYGDARRVLCGGTDTMFTPPFYAGWDNLGVMSRSDDPSSACRPFDHDRNGFVLGEGAGMVVLESLEEALSRGAMIRGELFGYGESSDATHITRPSAVGQAAAMSAALKSASLKPQDIDFINAHGTGTEANDACECEAIRLVFGSEVARVPVHSSKAYFGHMIGAAGIVETIGAIFCLESSRLHPNLNLDKPDPLCNLNLVGKQVVETTLHSCMKNSFGFGGNNAVVILGRYRG